MNLVKQLSKLILVKFKFGDLKLGAIGAHVLSLNSTIFGKFTKLPN